MYRDIKIHTKLGSSVTNDLPRIDFGGLDASTISLKVNDDGSVIYSGTHGIIIGISDQTNNKIGIGTSSPTATLSLSGASTLSDTFLNISNSLYPGIGTKIDALGNITIEGPNQFGTGYSQLLIKNTAGNSSSIVIDSANIGSALSLTRATADRYSIVANNVDTVYETIYVPFSTFLDSSHRILSRTGNTEVMYMDATVGNSKIGIGTTSPSSKLHIIGNDSGSATYSLKIDNSSSSSLLYVRNDGFVGIGTSTPTFSPTILEVKKNLASPTVIGISNNNTSGKSVLVFNGDTTSGYTYLGLYNSSVSDTREANGNLSLASTFIWSGGDTPTLNAMLIHGERLINMNSNSPSAYAFRSDASGFSIIRNNQTNTSNSTYNTALYVKGSGSASSSYSLKIDNSDSSPLLYVRNDGTSQFGTGFKILPGGSAASISGSFPIYGGFGNSFETGYLGVSNDISIIGNINFNSSGFSKIYGDGNYGIIYSSISGSETHRFIGNVGIGTASPTSKLHVYATQSGAFRLQDGTQNTGYVLTSDSNGVATWTQSSNVFNGGTGSFGVVFSKGDATITTSDTAKLIMPFGGYITGWRILEISSTPISSSIVVDVKKTTYDNYPSSFTSIAGSEKPTLSSAVKNQDLSLTTWTTNFNAGDVFEFDVESVTGAKNVSLLLMYVRTINL